MNQATATENTPPPAAHADGRQQMDIVVVGHVDHGKSTLVGRLLADTGSLPQGRLEQVRQQCARNARPFEYAFLLDALKDERAQGITIDSARCFFRTAKREYTIIDAPGHIEFLKNMISGAARAEAGLLVIDVKEGVQENSRRHGYLMSMLGIGQVVVLLNKMDLVDYRQEVYEAVRAEFSEFLSRVGITPVAYIPLAARDGANVARPGDEMPWYQGPTVLEMLDTLAKEPPPLAKPLRLPIQDVYKFTEAGDERRIFAGRIETGQLAVGDEVVFHPSGKRSRVKTIEAFNAAPPQQAQAGQSTGVTLETQIYVKPGELMVRASQDAPKSSTRLRANLFWLSANPMVKGKRYKLKLASARGTVFLTEIHAVIDAGDLSTSANRNQIERHDVAQVTLETLKPVACDAVTDIAQTGRFVIIDNYEIVGGGVVTQAQDVTNSLLAQHVRQRNQAWVRSTLTSDQRAREHNQRAALLVLTGPRDDQMEELGKSLEEHLHNAGHLAYYLGLSNQLLGLNADLSVLGGREEFLRRLGETAHLFTDAGMILITSVAELDDDELNILQTLNQPCDLVLASVGEHQLSRREPDLALEKVDPAAMGKLKELLTQRQYLEYQI